MFSIRYPIDYINISIGLDKELFVVYHEFMDKIIFSQKPKANPYKHQAKSRGELIGFVADQFKKLAKKNLRIPIQLYHL